jgi:hypothetical protein
LTPDDVGDVSELPGLLDQIDTEIASLTADGAHDGEVVYDAVASRHPDAEVIIPPRATAVPNETTTTQRDRHIAVTERHGRMGWQRRSGYNRRSLAEKVGCRVQAAPKYGKVADRNSRDPDVRQWRRAASIRTNPEPSSRLLPGIGNRSSACSGSAW